MDRDKLELMPGTNSATGEVELQAGGRAGAVEGKRKWMTGEKTSQPLWSPLNREP